MLDNYDKILPEAILYLLNYQHLVVSEDIVQSLVEGMPLCQSRAVIQNRSAHFVLHICVDQL